MAVLDQLFDQMVGVGLHAAGELGNISVASGKKDFHRSAPNSVQRCPAIRRSIAGRQLAPRGNGSFDVIAGLRKRAPPIMQRAGLEWAYRLAQEPRRLFRRYLVTNSQFVGLMSWNAIERLIHSQRVVPPGLNEG